MLKNTILMAHPDDEIIFGWPVLREAQKIIICSSDLNNPERAWCKNRKKALKEVCELLGKEMVCLDYNSEFYRTPTKDGSLKKMALDIQKETVGQVFTHNPWGEYGHLDHILINLLAKQKTDVFYSDIALEINWLPIKKVHSGVFVREVDNDLELYNKCKAIYDKYGCWTWSLEPVLKAKIYYDNSNGLQQ